jgi:hypothetical protein
MRKRDRRPGPAAARAVRLRYEESVVCGSDPARRRAAIVKYAEAGYDHVCVRQVGLDQPGFMRFNAREILPRIGARPSAA